MEPKMFVVKLTPAVQEHGESFTLQGALAGVCVFDTANPEHQMFLTPQEAADWSAAGWLVREKNEPKPKPAKAAEKE